MDECAASPVGEGVERLVVLLVVEKVFGLRQQPPLELLLVRVGIRVGVRVSKPEHLQVGVRARAKAKARARARPGVSKLEYMQVRARDRARVTFRVRVRASVVKLEHLQHIFLTLPPICAWK